MSMELNVIQILNMVVALTTQAALTHGNVPAVPAHRALAGCLTTVITRLPLPALAVSASLTTLPDAE